jgi:uncharacterized protein YndB with AHSA1/START domain
VVHPLLEHLYGPVVVETTIPTSPERVYAVLAEPSTYPGWLVGAERIRDVDDAFPQPGTGFDHEVGGGGLTVGDRTTSLDVDPGRELDLDVHAGPFHAHVRFELRSASGGATSVRLSEEPVGLSRGLTPVLRVALGARNRWSLARLRRRVVRGVPA